MFRPSYRTNVIFLFRQLGKPRVCLTSNIYSLTMEDLVATTSQSTPSPNGGYGNDKEGDAKRAQEEQMRRDLLATVLDTAARERCICFSFPRTQILVLILVQYLA